MGRIILIDHHKGKPDHLAHRRYHSVADRSRLAEQIVKGVFCVVVAVAKTADVKTQNLRQLIKR